MADLPNMIPVNIDSLLKGELQMIIRENDELRLEKEQLTTQLNVKTKLFENKEQEVQQLRHELKACEGERVLEHGWQPLPKFLTKKKAFLNINNNDESSFGYAVLYFIEREQLPKKNYERVNCFTNEMFKRHHLDTSRTLFSSQNVLLYEDHLQMNINVFSFLDDESRARHHLVISRKNYEHVAILIYWKGHYAPITRIFRLYSDITKHKDQKLFVEDASVTLHQKCFRET